ncbi:MAG: peroxiredoxin family protein [Myxococcaceae bacterium]
MRFPPTLFLVALAVACQRSPEPPAVRSKVTAETPVARLGTLPAGLGVAVGQPVPNVTAKDLDGKQVSLAEFTAKGPTLLVFYRGGWCPFCNFQIRELAAAAPKFAAQGISLLAVSVDRPDEGVKTRARYALPFPVLSDSDLAFVNGFNVANRVTDEEVARLGGFGMDLEASSARTHHVIAVPSLFLIDRAGIVRWAHADTDYKTRPKPEQILAALESNGVLDRLR